jgi:uncharacterized protein
MKQLLTILLLSIFLFRCGSETKSLIVDEAELLSDEEEEQLVPLVQRIEENYGMNLRVLTTKTTQEETTKAYSIKKMIEWELGGKDIGKGILITVVLDRKDVAIHTGPVAKQYLSDSACKRVTTEVIAPPFEENKYFEGLARGVSTLEMLLQVRQREGK